MGLSEDITKVVVLRETPVNPKIWSVVLMASVTGVVEIIGFVVREISARKVWLVAQKVFANPVDGLMLHAVKEASAGKDPSACQIVSAINVVGKTSPAARTTLVRRD